MADRPTNREPDAPPAKTATKPAESSEPDAAVTGECPRESSLRGLAAIVPPDVLARMEADFIGMPAGSMGDLMQRMARQIRRQRTALSQCRLALDALLGIDVARLSGCPVHYPACLDDEDGDFCGQDPCPHGDAETYVCADCGGDPSDHDEGCSTAPDVEALYRAIAELEEALGHD